MQSVRQLTSYVKELKAELTLKDEKIASLRSELSQAETALQQGRVASNSTPGVLTTAQSNKSAKRPNVEVHSFIMIQLSPLEVRGNCLGCVLLYT